MYAMTLIRRPEETSGNPLSLLIIQSPGIVLSYSGLETKAFTRQGHLVRALCSLKTSKQLYENL